MAESVIVVLGCPEGGAQSPCSGKFLQLALAGRDYLVFAAASVHHYHNQILAAFAATNGITYDWLEPGVLEVKDPTLTVRGGGRFRVDPVARVIEVWDNSQAYGRFDAACLPAQVAAAGHAWSGFAVRIE